MKTGFKKVAAVLMALTVLLSFTAVSTEAADYSAYDNTKVGWGLSYTKDHTAPGGTFPKGVDISQYDALYVGNTAEKVIYLTFDCGYDNGYTEGVLDYLKEKGIKACFFVTKDFVTKQPALTKRMRDEGHVIGNHTVRHKDMTTESVQEIKDEMKGVEDAVLEATGTKIDPFMRPPEGAYSVRVLKILQDLGYHTVFWSFAARDWDVNNQPGVDTVYNSFMEKYCNGCIPLLHIVSSSSTGAVKPIFETLSGQGYRFASLKELVRKDGEITVTIDRKILYNGKSVEPSYTTTNEGAEVKLSYYKRKDGKYYPIKKAPKAPGVYYVMAEVAATEEYNAAKSAKVHFHITKQL